jgi:hypothetical protein
MKIEIPIIFWEEGAFGGGVFFNIMFFQQFQKYYYYILAIFGAFLSAGCD